MRVYTNSLGITCIEPDKGYLLKKNGNTYKKVYLGINDRAELYEEVVLEQMEWWKFIRRIPENRQIMIYPVVGKIKGCYPDDFSYK